MGLASEDATCCALDNGIHNSLIYQPCCACIIAVASDEPSRSVFVRRCHMPGAGSHVCSVPRWLVLVFLYNSDPRQPGLHIECGMDPIAQGGRFRVKG